jgi:hypothetical protein
MTIRLKVEMRKQQQVRKIGELMEMFKVNPNYYQYQYQPTGASNFSNLTTTTRTTPIDPRIQRTKDLFQMFHLA